MDVERRWMHGCEEEMVVSCLVKHRALQCKLILHKIFCEAFSKWPRRRTGRLPASVIHGRVAGPATASINA